MSNWPLMFQPLAKYATFEGRSRRSEFWLWVLFRFILNAVLGSVVGGVVLSGLPMLQSHPEIFFANYMRVMPIFSLVGLALLIPTLAVAVRRLHDSNRTGWWLIAPYAAAMAGLIIFFILFGAQIFHIAQQGHEMTDAEGMAFAGSLFGTLALCFLPAIICDIMLLVFFLLDGTPGPNRFGSDPKGRGVTAQTEAF
ncbi:MAG: DUF805 domain-containing protein [Asticcacaulis sp.]|uniref:DUF805 domain-containing protein n=1 Tax=Asticcacaulis sp. TaxID=1872648 RepID=UPI003F7B51E3